MVAEGVGGCFTPKFRTCPAGSQPLAGLKPERRHLKAIMHPLAFEPIEELGARAEYLGARSAPFPLLTLIPEEANSAVVVHNRARPPQKDRGCARGATPVDTSA